MCGFESWSKMRSCFNQMKQGAAEKKKSLPEGEIPLQDHEEKKDTGCVSQKIAANKVEQSNPNIFVLTLFY